MAARETRLEDTCEITGVKNEHAALIASANFPPLRQFDFIEREEETLIVWVEYRWAEQVGNLCFGEDLESFFVGHDRNLIYL